MSEKKYDYSPTLFSPNGRLMQVEYAITAVKNGQPAIAVRGKDGIVLATENHTSRLMVESKKIARLSTHNVCVYGGIGADARLIVDKARGMATNYNLDFNGEIPIKQLAHRIGEYMQGPTQVGRSRPFGTSLLVSGWNEGEGKAELYQIDPSGTYFGMNAAAIGKNDLRAKNFLEEHYQADMGMEDCAHMALRALREAIDMPMGKELVEVAYCTADGVAPLAKDVIEALISDL